MIVLKNKEDIKNLSKKQLIELAKQEIREWQNFLKTIEDEKN